MGLQLEILRSRVVEKWGKIGFTSPRINDLLQFDGKCISRNLGRHFSIWNIFACLYAADKRNEKLFLRITYGKVSSKNLFTPR